MQGHVKGQCGSRPPPALPPGLGAPLLLWAWELLQGGGGGVLRLWESALSL